MKIIFFGTPEFSAKVLSFLLENGANVVAVISKPDKPKGRSSTPVPTPVKAIALNNNPPIPIYQPDIVSAPGFADTLRSFQADLFVVVAYGEIIKQHLLDMPCLGCINMHVSLLPKYRGAAPIQRCIIEGENESGVTIMHMVKKMDAGDIIEVIKVPITPDMTFGDLEQILCDDGKKLLLKVIKDFEKGIIKRTPQDHSQSTLAPKIELEDCEIDWNWPAKKIHDLVRGVNPYPGAWCTAKVKNEQKRLKIWRTKIHSSSITHKEPPGTILSGPKQNLLIATGHDNLELVEIQLEGKKMMSSKDLLLGLSLNDFSLI